MSVKKNVYNEREVRLECLKLAAALCMQLKHKQESVVGVAKQFMAFVIEGDPEDEDEVRR